MTPLAEIAARLVTPPPLPPGSPPGVRITLLADYQRAKAAAELAGLLATGACTWETCYPELKANADPQAAAATLALAEANDTLTTLRAALTRAAATASEAARDQAGGLRRPAAPEENRP